MVASRTKSINCRPKASAIITCVFAPDEKFEIYYVEERKKTPPPKKTILKF